jgi:serine/threonine protein kinase
MEESTSKKEKYTELELENIKTDLSEYSEKSGIQINPNKIGQGGFSLIYLGSKEKRTYAIKLIYIGEVDKSRTSNMAKSEVIITGNLKNKNCIRCHGNYDTNRSKIMVLDYMPNKDLSFLIHLFYHNKLFNYINIPIEDLKQNKFPFISFFSESLIRFFILQVVNALDYLRKMNFIHRDLKPENCLLTKNFQIKLSDFALSSAVPFWGDLELNGSGTGVYMPPECFLPNIRSIPVKHAFKLDYYALGIMLYKMLFNDYIGKLNEEGKIDIQNLLDTLDEINSNKFYFYERYGRGEEYLSNEVKDLLLKLINKDYEKRIDLEEINSHPWFKKNDGLINFVYDVHDSDCFYFKFLHELQKLDCIKFYNSKRYTLHKYQREENKTVTVIKFNHFKFKKSGFMLKKNNLRKVFKKRRLD